mgnify:CR=1 FL=1
MIQILSGVSLFFLGIMVGAVFHRSFQGEASKNKRLEQKLAELQDTYSRYQAEVSEHFIGTARAVQTLNKSYRDVHAQLAKGASRLCNEEHANDFLSINLSSGTPNTSETQAAQSNDHFAPPMDYAPKETPDAEGTLSERYGLSNESNLRAEDGLNVVALDENSNTENKINTELNQEALSVKMNQTPEN